VTGILQRDTVLLGDVENRTNDPLFDGSLRQALLLQLAQSPYLQILPDQRVHSVLQNMMRAADTPILGSVALEICQRTATKAAITGSIVAFGDEYVIGLAATSAEGDLVVSEQARARGKGEVLRALDAASLSLRGKLGESLASMERFSGPFEEVATPSLEALKAYTLGRREWFRHGDAAAIPHFARAIELDGNFVSAHSALALACMNMGQARRGRELIDRAYGLRERVSARERARVTAIYWTISVGDLHRSLDAYHAWMEDFPRDGTAAINAGGLYMILGQFERAYEASEEGRLFELTSIAHSNVAIILMALGRHGEARAVLESAFARGLDAYFLHLDAYQEAFLRGDTETMRAHFRAVEGRATEEDFLLAAQANTEAFNGHHDRARELSKRAAESALRAGATEMSGVWQAEAALREAELGNRERAKAGAISALETVKGRHVECIAAYALARAGDVAGATNIAADLDREWPNDTIVQRQWLPCIRAAIALDSGDGSGAVEFLEPAASMELGLVPPFEGGLAIAPWLRGTAYLVGKRYDDAAREFRKIVEHPGIVKNFFIYPLAKQHLEQL